MKPIARRRDTWTKPRIGTRVENSRFLADTLAEPVPVRRPGEELIDELEDGEGRVPGASVTGNTNIGSNRKAR